MDNQLERLRSVLPERYALERQIGRGGMATVYLADDRQLQRKVAIKVLRPELCSTLGAARFQREVTIAAGLTHRNIVALYDAGESDGTLWYAMPYVAGESLRAALDRDGRFSLDRALSIARDIADGLDYAHERGVVHRDIKPQNVLLTQGYAQITDFGVARAIEAATDGDITSSGVAIGTAAYMAPEQASGQPGVDARADVYSLGCVLYEMLSGELPFPATSVRAMLVRQLMGTVPSVAKRREDVPTGVSDAIQRALSKSPGLRFESASHLVDTLERCAAGESPMRVPGVAGWISWIARSRRRVLTAVGVALALIAVPTAFVLSRGDGSPLSGRPASAVVLPFHAATSSATEREMTSDLVSELIRELNQWEPIRVVPRVALSGPMFDLGLEEPTIGRLEVGLRLAREFHVEALVAVELTVRDDSAFAEAGLYDAIHGTTVGRPLQARGPIGDILSLVTPLVRGILALEGPLPLARQRRQSSNPAALSQDAEGQRLLSRWRLEEAERAFREAVRLDSTFGMAFHRLAQTLYWQAAESPGRLSDLGPEIAAMSAASLRHSSGLAWPDTTHVRAFYAFQEGDYPTARSLYRVLLARDSTDVYAWLMMGSVEYRDPWLTEAPEEGTSDPRGDLNVAVQAFSETIRYQPTFDLGYGHLFDIHRSITRAIDRRECIGFERPRGELLAPWEAQTPHQQSPRCPVVAGDSIVWLTESRFDAFDRSAAIAGADRLFDRAMHLLRRWAAYSPDMAKPRDELVGALLTQRSRLGIVPPERIDSLAREALRFAGEALALRSDTVPGDLLRLAAIELGAGNRERALRLARSGVAWEANGQDEITEAERRSGASVFLAAGRPTDALPLVSTPTRRRFIYDDSTESLISYAGAEGIIDRLRVLGATGIRGPPLDRELSALDRVWSAGALSARERRLLRRDAAYLIMPALATSREALESWETEIRLEEPVWRALLVEDGAGGAEARIRRALDSETPLLAPATKAFLLGLAARGAGEHALAARLFARLDSLPLALEGLELGWGLRSLALPMRADAHRVLGDTARALDDHERFAKEWAEADSWTAGLVEDARRSAQHLRSPP